MLSLLRKYLRRFLVPLAYVWRRLLFRTTFIAITGSVGKTTAKECLAGILSAHAHTIKTFSNHNELPSVAHTILRVRPWHRYAVLEIATSFPGAVRQSARLVRPHIGIVLAVARTHTDVFSSLEDTAEEKAGLVEALRPGGLAILNGEDPRVKRMASRCRCKVKMFGRSEGHDLWADQISSRWPERLTFQANTRIEQQHIEMKLVGEHWVNSVLAALLAAQSCGIPLESAAEALREVEPFPARMQPVLLPCGATMLRDELNGSEETWGAASRVLETCQAVRRVLVMGDVSDWHKRSHKAAVRYRELGQMAARVADVAIFISEHAHHAEKAAVKSGMKPECVHSFIGLNRAAEYLKSELRPGDVVLLRGRTTQHLSRIFFAQLGAIGCWRTDCRKTIVCDECNQLHPDSNLKSNHETLKSYHANRG